MTWSSPATQARVDLGTVIHAAIAQAEDFMREAEAQHARVKADPLFTDADHRASLTEVTLSHRALALLRPLAEMLPVVPEETPIVVPTAHRVVHPPAPGWSRAPEEVMGGTIGGLARALYVMAKCDHFDLHLNDVGSLRIYINVGAYEDQVASAIFAAFTGRKYHIQYVRL